MICKAAALVTLRIETLLDEVTVMPAKALPIWASSVDTRPRRLIQKKTPPTIRSTATATTAHLARPPRGLSGASSCSALAITLLV